MSILEVKNIKYKYDKYNESSKYALNDVSFSIDESEFTALIGESGSGKSTLISHLNGLYRADSGDILFKGKSIYDKDFNLTNLRFKCGIVFQYPEYQLFSETVLEDVAFGAIKKGLSKDEAYKKSLEVLKMLGIDHLKDETPFNLSGGEKRKVAFAGVFVMDPDILIFDEPDAGLDPVSKDQFYKLLKMLNQKYKTTIIYITHNLDDVIEYANKVIVLKEGTVLKEGKPYEVLTDKEIMSKANLDMPYAVEIYYELLKLGRKIDISKLKFDELKETLIGLK
ncbi:MAG: energy-coupling factor transporter ATPase [Lachnospiraceae bacterium]|nr:energy-coupling factor transporter ATPase [Lachnospiraceae bacterium]